MREPLQNSDRRGRVRAHGWFDGRLSGVADRARASISAIGVAQRLGGHAIPSGGRCHLPDRWGASASGVLCPARVRLGPALHDDRQHHPDGRLAPWSTATTADSRRLLRPRYHRALLRRDRADGARGSRQPEPARVARRRYRGAGCRRGVRRLPPCASSPRPGTVDGGCRRSTRLSDWLCRPRAHRGRRCHRRRQAVPSTVGGADGGIRIACLGLRTGVNCGGPLRSRSDSDRDSMAGGDAADRGIDVGRSRRARPTGGAQGHCCLDYLRWRALQRSWCCSLRRSRTSTMRRPHSPRLRSSLVMLRAYSELRQEIAARQRTEMDLRASEAGYRRVAVEQSALRRIATLVAHGAAPGVVFTAVAEEVGRAVPNAEISLVGRYAPDATIEYVGAWGKGGHPPNFDRGPSCRSEAITWPPWCSTAIGQRGSITSPEEPLPATVLVRPWARSSAGVPISVEGRLWGVMIVASRERGELAAGRRT